MPATPNPRAWKIFPAADGHFRWAAAEGVDAVRRTEAPIPAGEDHHLPSMADLLIQAGPVLLESGGAGYGGQGLPMFHTGSGRSVLLSEMSMRRARVVLGGGDSDRGYLDSGAEALEYNRKDDSFPMFRTGSGKSVPVKESSLRKAAAVFHEELLNEGCKSNLELTEGQGFLMFHSGSGKSVTLKESSIVKGGAVLEEEDLYKGHQVVDCSDKDQRFPMFHTGSGKLLTVKESSVMKAAAILEAEDIKKGYQVGDYRYKDQHFPIFCAGSGKLVTVNESSITKVSVVLEEEEIGEGNQVGDYSDKNEGFPMFRTGSGKPVTVNKSSIMKAAAVLGGEDINKGNLVADRSDIDQGFPFFGSGESVIVRDPSILKAAVVLEGDDINKGNVTGEHSDEEQGTPMFHTGLGKSVRVKRKSITKAATVLEGEDINNDPPQSYIIKGKGSLSNSLFQTASGKTVDLSSAGLFRATTLLGLDRGEDLSTPKSSRYAINECNTKQFINCEKLHENFMGDIKSGPFATSMIGSINYQSVQGNSINCIRDFHSTGYQEPFRSKIHTSDPGLPPMKFHTAGGRSIPVTKDALQRARSLLGDPELGHLENEDNIDQPFFSDKRPSQTTVCNKENIPPTCFSQNEKMSKQMSRTLHCPSNFKCSSTTSWSKNSQNFMLDQGNAGCFRRKNIAPSSSGSGMSHLHKLSKNRCVTHTTVGSSRVTEDLASSRSLLNISNNFIAESTCMNQLPSENRKLAKRRSISPFKRPRTSRFTTPLKPSISFLANGSSRVSVKEGQEIRISTYYPFKFRRKSVQEFFGTPPTHQNKYGHLPDEVKHMNANSALTYRFHNASGHDEIGADYFRDMLLQAGALAQYATENWVANHYKWIVWKLSCFERCYPTQASAKYLTVTNVLEELKYRYEREINYGHRSAIKRILEGDASPASVMVLCVSAIHSSCQTMVPHEDINNAPDEETKELSNSLVMESNMSKIELTDGWYSVDAFLDLLLGKQLLAGKLFVGQKLRVLGAALSGWGGPISPLEASNSVNLRIHINGTYRAHWADRLGLCKYSGPPLSFSCIKGGGGKVPRTMVGITRIYPILYKERFADGGSVIRSERMEKKVLQLYHKRQYNIAEGVMYQQQDITDNDNDSDEGAKVYKILENAAEPEVLMANMTSEQLASFSNYQAKKREIRQADVQKKIETALKDAGLSSRDVTPFMKVRVVGLTSKCSQRKDHSGEGLITIWNPTENQKVDLVEGKMYIVAGLTPLNSGTDILYLQGRGSSTIWKTLSSLQTEEYEPFFSPRKSVFLSNLGQVPLSSEFDIAATILHVGEVYISGSQKKQWIFMTDGCSCNSTIHSCLLAVNFSSPIIENDLSAIFSHNFVGIAVGFYNLVKRARDQMNHLWVAEATEYSTYSVSYSIPDSSHLKLAANAAQKWAKESNAIIQKLKERVLCILGAS